MSTNFVQPGSFLHRVLFADAAVSAAVGLLMALAAAPLASLLGLSSRLLAIAGIALLPYAAYLIWLATRRMVPRGAVWLPIGLNLVWAVDCLLILFASDAAPTLLGQAFVWMHVVTVLVFAELEYMGLRRAAAMAG